MNIPEIELKIEPSEVAPSGYIIRYPYRMLNREIEKRQSGAYWGELISRTDEETILEYIPEDQQ